MSNKIYGVRMEQEEIDAWNVAEAQNYARQLIAATDQIGELTKEHYRLKQEIKERERKSAELMLKICKENILTGDETRPYLDGGDAEYMQLWESEREKENAK